MASFPQELSAGVPAAPVVPSWFRRNIATRRFLIFSIAIHLLFAAGASVFIAQRIVSPRNANFIASPPTSNPGARAREHKVQMAQKQKTMSAPAQMKRVTTLALNTNVALPAMPVMPAVTNGLSPMKMAGMGGTGVGMSIGGAGSSGGPAGRGGPVSLFGLRSAGGGSLVGTFYDFKQTASGQSTPMTGDGTEGSPLEKTANDESGKLVGRFANGGFNENTLSNYFKGPVPLYATQIFIPSLPADNGPKEFGLADKVKPRRWVIVYRGRVSPPESGRYRFVGEADDFLVVRMNNRIVLDGCVTHPTGKKPTREYQYDRVQFPCAEGDYFDATAGDHLDIQILIGEQPGGNFNTYLMVQKEGADCARDPKGNPILPIFKIARSENTATDGPVTAADTSWSVWKGERP